MKKLDFYPATPLYTSDEQAWRADQLSDALKTLYGARKPIVLFVHGRGMEPNKSLRGAKFSEGLAVHKLELGYDAKVLMFNWDSAFPVFPLPKPFDRDKPLKHTGAAAIALGAVLKELHEFQAANPNLPKPAMVVHSMGSIVMQKLVEAKLWTADGLFSNVLFSQPDADDVGHATWMQWLAERERVYITLNKDDHVLLKSTDARPPEAHALGLGTDQPLAQKAHYIDISHVGPMGEKDNDHEVFAKSAMNGQLFVCQFFTQTVTGNSVTLDPKINVESVDRNVIYKMKSRIDRGAPCLQRPTLPRK